MTTKGTAMPKSANFKPGDTVVVLQNAYTGGARKRTAAFARVERLTATRVVLEDARWFPRDVSDLNSSVLTRRGDPSNAQLITLTHAILEDPALREQFTAAEIAQIEAARHHLNPPADLDVVKQQGMIGGLTHHIENLRNELCGATWRDIRSGTHYTRLGGAIATARRLLDQMDDALEALREIDGKHT